MHLCLLQWMSPETAAFKSAKHMKQFVAMTDEMLYRPDGPPGPLVPYQIGVFCWHQLREEVRDSLGASRAPEMRDLLREPRDALSA